MQKQAGKRVLIIGAGRAGEALGRAIIAEQEFQPLGYLDNDSKKHGREIHGIRVLGNLDDLEGIAARLSVEIALLAIPSANREVVNQIVNDCAEIGLKCQTLPSVVELTGKEIEVKHLRPVTVNDLLGREPVELDRGAISGYLRGKTILVTGGGGSIGSELCRQIAQVGAKKLIVFEHSEFNLYSIEHELNRHYPDLDLIAVLGDVKIGNRVEWAFKTFQPEVVFHAAAYKHVPMVEKNPAEGVFNNVIGTKVVADAADRFGVKRFVLVSTDKAVNPANVMGATKRIAELYCQNLATRSKTKFITTRFGNVLGSAGSVVPLFEKQIQEGGPVTITHKDITRYFMTIPESVGLILQAGFMGLGGEIFVLEMGEPILIRELAEQMIRLSGFRVGLDIKLEYSGLRPGEKLYEEIFHDSEGLIGTEHPKLQLARSREVDWEWLQHELDELRVSAQSRDVGQLLKHLRNIVPEFDGGSRGTANEAEEPAVKLRVLSGGQ
jgi:FlaA1/EpsC-like NDP-sugar epimerase